MQKDEIKKDPEFFDWTKNVLMIFNRHNVRANLGETDVPAIPNELQELAIGTTHAQWRDTAFPTGKCRPIDERRLVDGIEGRMELTDNYIKSIYKRCEASSWSPFSHLSMEVTKHKDPANRYNYHVGFFLSMDDKLYNNTLEVRYWKIGAGKVLNLSFQIGPTLEFTCNLPDTEAGRIALFRAIQQWYTPTPTVMADVLAQLERRLSGREHRIQSAEHYMYVIYEGEATHIVYFHSYSQNIGTNPKIAAMLKALIPAIV